MTFTLTVPFAAFAEQLIAGPLTLLTTVVDEVAEHPPLVTDTV
jgi:hypothetical protein